MKKQILSRVGALLLALAMAVSMTATAWAVEGEDENTDPPAPAQPGITVKITADSEVESTGTGKPILRHSRTTTLTATVEGVPADATCTYSWDFGTSNGAGNDRILSFVDESKTNEPTVQVTGRNIGDSMVLASVVINGEKYEGYFDLAVRYAPAQMIELRTNSGLILNDQLSREPGSTWSMTATVHPDNASQNATWTTSNSSVVALDSNTALGNAMNFRAVNPGESTITATVDNVSASCKVIVSGLAITQSGSEVENVELKVGKTATLGYIPYGQSLSDPNLAVSWSTSNRNVAELVENADGTVTINAISEGTANITIVSGTYSRTCYVKVIPNEAQVIRTGVPDMILNFSERVPLYLGNSSRTSSIIDAIAENCREVTGYELNYVSGISVSTSQGTLYYGYTSEGDTGSGVGGSERYYAPNSLVYGQRALSGISFVPKADFSGTATVYYTGYGGTGTNAKAFTGQILLDISVVEDVAYTTTTNTPVQFKGADFSTVCTERNGRGLSSISLTQPTKGEGTIYYNYTGSTQTEVVTSNRSYFISRAPYINSLSFVPATGFTGTVKIPYSAIDNANTKYTGTITIVVTPTNGEASISYSAVAGETVEFKVDDFTKACTSALGADSTLNYVIFDLPSSAEGTLSYSYRSGNTNYGGNVSAGERFYYYRAGTATKPLSSVRFTPASKATGSVMINFNAYDTNGKHFKGTVRIYVGNEGDGGVIQYSSTNGAPVRFDVESFNELCQSSIKESLDYVTFTLPSTLQGTLFYNYNNSYLTGSAVNANTRYYRSGSSLISNITFVPNLSYSGVVSIGFTAYGTAGGHFIGAVIIDVSSSSDRTIRYTVLQGDAVKLNVSDFNSLCQSATGRDLSYLRFTVPTSMRGTLCYNYNEEKNIYSSKVSSNTNYYRANSSQLIENISYLSEANYSGKIQLQFNGWSTGGAVFSGLMEIDVMAPVARTITYAGNSLAFDLRSSDFSSACQDLTGKRLDYIQFDSLPSASAGTLYTGFSGPMEHGEAARTGVKYYISGTPSIDGLAFLPKAGYDDIVTLTYTGVDVSGTKYTGTVQMAINNYGTSGYVDMGGHSWAEGSVNFLTAYGVVNGTGGNNFSPAQSIRRADYMMMICRAFRLNTGNRTGFSDVSPNSYYAWAVSTAKDMGIAQGDGSNFYPESSLTREDAMVLLQRTLDVVGQSIGSGSESYLNGFSDAGSVSPYARNAVAAMIQRGLITGDGYNRLNPKQPISRAEMAVFLHRVLTM